MRAALALDLWFEQKLGSLYHVLMGIGLVGEIVRSVREFDAHLGVSGNLFQTELPVIVSALLLVNQVGSLSQLGKRRSLDSRHPS